MHSDLTLFTSPRTYISGMTALSIPDEGRWGGDWHFVNALCLPTSRIHSSGEKGSMTNTNQLFGDRFIIEKSAILLERGISNHGLVFCASHTRAIADLVFHSIIRDIYPTHVIVDGILEESVEWEEMNGMLDVMIRHVGVKQASYITRWKNEFLETAKNGVLQ